ncbi:MAG: hypothetical protein EA427_12480 [Spirochaetaceae bacterium]|nr:MAG: hypothetical protein EA427_12480 [Spirochaetaceae bacterium]
MTVQEGTPWQPTHFDDLLQEPFERLQERQVENMLERMDCMIVRLEQIEHDLDEVLKDAPAGATTFP